MWCCLPDTLNNKDLALTWVAVDPVQTVSGLRRKLPHYHKYSYLGFNGTEPVNILKGRWPVFNSPLIQFVRHDEGAISSVEMAKLASREPLTALPSIFSNRRMMEVTRFLSSNDIRGRGFGTTELDRTAELITQRFQEAGVPAVQLFSGPDIDYHRPTDTVDKINRQGLLKVASITREVIEYLAGRPEPLTSMLTAEGEALSVVTPSRKVNLGTIPDFT